MYPIVLLTLLAGAPGKADLEASVQRARPQPAAATFATAPILAPWRPGDPVRIIPRRHADDPLGQRLRPPVNAVIADPTTAERAWQPSATGKTLGGLLVDIGEADGAQGFIGGFPADPVGDVGPEHYVQATNGSGGAVIRIFDKATGSLARGPVAMSSLANPSTPCRSSAAGDPIILYDELAQRWLISEFTAQGPNQLCVYVSATSNALTTTWNAYSFQAPSFPDYPKYAVWTDAYYVTSNEGAGPAVYAMDRNAMLAGEEAALVRFVLAPLAGFGFQTPTPADHDGSRAPLGPGLFLRHRDDEIHAPGANDPTGDALELYELIPDFENVGQSELRGPTLIPVGEFDSELCGGSFSCFPQPGAAPGLDPVREVVMWRLQYRRFESHETLLATYVTDVSGQDRGGIRVVELRRVGGPASAWTVAQELTLGPPGDGDSRFMGSAAMDASGNIALGYSVTGNGTFPSLRYTGRAAGDPPGQLTSGELTIVDGSASQTAADRWGDYAALSVDPSDGCTFWFTSMFTPAPLWSTRIASFRFDACGSPGFNLIADLLAQNACLADGAQALAPITIEASALGGFAGAIALAFEDLPTGVSGTITPSTIAVGASATAEVTVSPLAAAGRNTFGIVGTADGVDDQRLSVNVEVNGDVPAAVSTTVPLPGATGVIGTPTFRWSAAARATGYRFQLADSASFASPLIDTTVQGTAFAPDVTLADDREFFWRVAARNVCGEGAFAPTASFRTAARVGSGCPAGTTSQTVFADDLDTGAPDWAVLGFAWALFDGIPGFAGAAWLIEFIEEATLESVATPFLDLPDDASQLLLRFRNARNIETVQDACADGGVLEFTGDDLNFFLIEDDKLGDDPYTAPILNLFSNPFGDLPAWCGETGEVIETVADVTELAGTTVSFLWTLATDSSIGTVESWVVDDVELLACFAPSAPTEDEIFRSGFEADEVAARALRRWRPSPDAARRIHRGPIGED